MTKDYFSLIKRTCELYIQLTGHMIGSDIIAQNIADNIAAVEKDLARLAAYDAVLAATRRYTVPHPEDLNWTVSDALDTLACNSSYTANDIGKFPLKDLYESEEKLAKLEDIYDKHKSDCIKELEKLCTKKPTKKEEDD